VALLWRFLRPMKKFDGRSPKPLLCNIIHKKKRYIYEELRDYKFEDVWKILSENKKVYLRRTLYLYLKIKIYIFF